MIYRNYGVELEMGDINTHMAARIVFNKQGLDYENDWKDRGYTGFTKVTRYDIWNVSSDGTLVNSNGTRCMHSVMVDGKKKGAHPGNSHLWQGAELISPIITVDKSGDRWAEFVGMLTQLKLNGADCRADLRHAFHVHIDVQDWDLDRMKEFVSWINAAQYMLGKFVTEQKNAGYPIRYFKNELVDKMLASTTEEDFWYWYRMHRKSKGGPSEETNFQFRRLVCLNPRLNSLSKRGTIEWRLWPATLHIPDLFGFISFSQECTQNLPSMEYVKTWIEEHSHA